MDKHQNQEILADYLNELQFGGSLHKLSYQNGKKLYELGRCHLLSSTPNEYHFEVDDDYHDFNVSLSFSNKKLAAECNCGAPGICAHKYACMQQTQQEMSRSFLVQSANALQYSRDGMVKRVMEERRKRAEQETFQIQFAENIHGEHVLTTSQNKKYKLSFYDFNKNLGYCSCPDYQTNKLETCKHLIYAFDKFEEEMGHNELPNQSYPFLEIFRHPLYDYQISWFYPQEISMELQNLIEEYFDENQIWKAEKWPEIPEFIDRVKAFKLVKIRPEVNELIESYFEKQSLQKLFEDPDSFKDIISPDLFPYQIEGARFIAARKGSFLADEIGLGKSATALSAGVLKIKYLNFKKVLIISPDELKNKWKSEIIRWVPEQIRADFKVLGMNQIPINSRCDFLIIDEAQKIDDFESGLIREIAMIKYQHIVLITDSKYENSLMKFHAISTLINQHMLTPLWELSYKHCLFDPQNPEKILAYHHLDLVGKRLAPYYIRRERIQVLEQLPPAQLMEISVSLNSGLLSEQSRLAEKTVKLCKKTQLNHYDWVQLKDQLKEMLQMSRFNFSKRYTASQSPKMIEFRHFILHKLNLSKDQKVVVFAEGKDLQNQIIRTLNLERLQATFFVEGEAITDEIQFYILEENGQSQLSFAQHFVYFHLPKNPALIEQRMEEQSKIQSGISQSLFYLIKSVGSFESLVFNWQMNKPHFIKQLLSFIYMTQNQKDLSLRLREELAHELIPLILEKESVQDAEVQMDLFGEEVQNRAKKSPAESPVKNEVKNDLQNFFNTMIAAWKDFEELNEEQKKWLKTGKVQVENKEGEILIRIQKK